MAIGDEARAAGLADFPSSQDRRLGWQNDMQRGDELARAMARIKTLEDRGKVGAWTKVDFSSGWGNNTDVASWGNTEWRRIGDQYIELRGQIVPRSGYVLDETMFRLPTEARPPVRIQGTALENYGTPYLIAIRVDPDGTVRVNPTGTRAINLAGFRFSLT
jgi:hypothetical protein